MSRETAQQTTELVARARAAVSTLRDAVRLGHRIDFRERDPLVLSIHAALDLLEPLRPAGTERTDPA